MSDQASSMPGRREAAVLSHSLTRALHGMRVHLEGLADSILHGDRLSGFPGRGLEAVGVREYQTGDEARGIDWRVTARRGRLHVREFDEERDLPTLVVIHRSATLQGGRGGIRGVRALETAGLLAALALKSGDRAGLLQGTDASCQFSRPSRGKNQLLRILAGLLAPFPEGSWHGLGSLLEVAGRLAPERTRVFLISDFQIREEEGLELSRRMAETAQRHALTPVWITDPGEGVFPGPFPLPLVDPRTGGVLRRQDRRRGGPTLREALGREEAVTADLFRGIGIRAWRVDVTVPLVPTLRKAMAGDPRRGGCRV